MQTKDTPSKLLFNVVQKIDKIELWRNPVGG